MQAGIVKRDITPTSVLPPSNSYLLTHSLEIKDGQTRSFQFTFPSCLMATQIIETKVSLIQVSTLKRGGLS